MEYKDYYKTLDLNKNASEDEIRDAFRKLARQYHPDANKGDKGAEEKFKKINEAYQVLSDSEKRKKYDQFGAQWQQYTRTGGRPEDFNWGRWAGGSVGTSTSTVTPEELEEIFGEGFGLGGTGGFSDFFETIFGRGTPGGQAHRTRGRDVEQQMEISLDEAFRGTSRIFQRQDGSRMEVKIPKGVRTGSRVRISGKGGAGSPETRAGDLYLRVKVAPHPTFKREKNDLKVTFLVDLYTLILGGKVEVPTLERSVKLTIPPQTIDGKTFRLRGLGMPELRNADKRGDIFAKVKIQLPTDLSDEEKQLFKRLQALQDEKM